MIESLPYSTKPLVPFLWSQAADDELLRPPMDVSSCQGGDGTPEELCEETDSTCERTVWGCPFVYQKMTDIVSFC